MKKLYVVDFMNIAMRSYHGFNKEGQKLTNSKGKYTFLCYGVALCFNRLINEHKPDQIVIAVDSKGETFRHKLFPNYKTGRKPADPEFTEQLVDLWRMVDAYGFRKIAWPATEADDIIGTVVTQALKDPDTEVVIVSGDKDMMQLIEDRVSILKPENMGGWKRVGAEQVMEKFGCKPENVVDALAIIGDAADAVPGVMGIGEKGAAGLIKTFGSLEKIYERLPEIKPALAQKLIKSKDVAFLSKDLVTIRRDIPVTYVPEECAVGDVFQRQELKDFFLEMDFRSFLMQSSDLIADLGL